MLSALRLRPAFFLLSLPLALLAFLGWRHWQGPELPAYRVTQRPLVQRVVASGEVSSQSLAKIGSELTGVVKARHVREGDPVHPGDLLLELDDSEQLAKLREAEAALRQLIDSDRPQAQAALREAESQLVQAGRERQRRDELFARQLLATETRDQASAIRDIKKDMEAPQPMDRLLCGDPVGNIDKRENGISGLRNRFNGKVAVPHLSVPADEPELSPHGHNRVIGTACGGDSETVRVIGRDEFGPFPLSLHLFMHVPDDPLKFRIDIGEGEVLFQYRNR